MRVTADIRRAAWLSAAALVAIAATVAALTSLQRTTHGWVEHSREVARISRSSTTLLSDAQRIVRDYVGSNRPQDARHTLDVLANARRKLGVDADSLVAITAVNPVHQRLALAYRDALQRWEAVDVQVVHSAIAGLGTPRSSFAGDSLLHVARTLGDSLSDFEDRQYTGRLRTFNLLQNAALIAVGIEVLLVLFVLARMANHVVTQARGLERQSEGLAVAVDEAEQSRRRAEAAAKQKARLAAMLDAALSGAPIGFAFFDDELRFLRVNPGLARLDKRDPEEHIGLTLRDVAPWIADDVEPYLVKALATREPQVNVPITDARDDGTTKHFLASYYPIVTDDDELLGVGAAVLEITDRVALQAQLQQAQKMDAIGRLAGGITHDFNNLLTVIGTSAELISLNPDVKESEREVGEIRAAVERAAALTRQLLTFSRQQPTSPKVIDPNDTIRGMHELLRRLLLGGIQIHTELAPDLHLARIDPGQLEQVIMNLAINAADAMENSGTVTIRTANVVLPREGAPADAAPGRYAMLCVGDTGHGMDQATMDRIFEPFFTTKAPGRGTGLGLATVYGIVRQGGGYVGVSSRPHAGSTFCVYLPAFEPGAR